MSIEYIENFFKRIADEYGIPVEMNRKGKTLEVSVPAIGFSRGFSCYDDAVYDVVEVGENVEMTFDRRGEIRISVYTPGSGWEDREELSIGSDIQIIGSEFEKSKDKGKYTILFSQDNEE